MTTVQRHPQFKERQSGGWLRLHRIAAIAATFAEYESDDCIASREEPSPEPSPIGFSAGIRTVATLHASDLSSVRVAAMIMDASAVHAAQIGNRQRRAQKVFQRAYMACRPCRSAKAKCKASDTDLSACIRCKQRSLPCVFSPVRSSKRLHSRSENRQQRSTSQRQPAGASGRPGSPSINASNVLQPTQSSKSLPLPPASGPSPRASGQGALGRGRPTLPSSSSPPRNPDARWRVGLEMDLLHTVLSSSRDAVRLLCKAADPQPEDTINDVTRNSSTLLREKPPPQLLHVESDPKEPPDEILHLWNQSHFVVHGWLTARQAVAYIDFFYSKLSCLSLVTNLFYSRYENHGTLIFEQHLLCSTLLMIASRYHPLLGTKTIGQSYHVHDLLWRHVQQLIQGLTFGEDISSVSSNSASLGNVEALLLLTEWYPRAVTLPSNTTTSYMAFAKMDETGRVKPQSTWHNELLGLAKRADRMSWMMLGIASSLSHELGVYNDDDTTVEKQRLRRLLYINVNQLALTLGCTSSLGPTTANTAVPSSALALPAEAPFLESEKVISLWIDLTGLLKTVRTVSFSYPGRLTCAACEGVLDHFQPLLDQWFNRFQDFTPPESLSVAVDLLFVDYQYVRMYVSSVGIQVLFSDFQTDADPKATISEILRRTAGSELQYVQEVIDASSSILSKAIALRSSGVLRFCPARVFFRIVSACVFLLKALYFSALRPDFFQSLNLLDQCTDALASLPAEDDSPWAKYAELIQRYAQRLRQRPEAPHGTSSLASLGSDGMQTYDDDEMHRTNDDACMFDPFLTATDDWPVHAWDFWMPSASESQFDYLSPTLLTGSHDDPNLLSPVGLV